MKKNTISPRCSAWEMKQKKKYFSLFILLFSLTVSAQTNLSTAENYVYTKNCLDADCIKKAETVQYFDGLGRPVQSIAIKATPLGRDVVMPVEYDSKGREAKSYLPVPQAGTANGAIYTDPLGNASAAGYGNERIYAEKIYDNIYTGRVNQMVSTGTVWSQKPVNLGYDTNADGEVKKYTINTEWTEGRTNSGITLAGSYAANQLMKNSVTDQDGNTTTEFQNGEGQTVLVRKNDGLQNVDTYYLYNEYGQQAYVIPPLAVADTVPDQAVLDKLCYQYRYDGMGKLVEKKLPGKGWEYFIYDQQDRLILTQDANLRTTTNTFGAKGWIFTKYDKYGRVVYTGFYPTTELRSALQTTATGIMGSIGNNEERTTAFFVSNGMTVYYSQNAFPSVGLNILNINYYDMYPIYSFNPAFPAAILGSTVISDMQNAAVNTRNLPVLSLIKNIEDDNWTKSYGYYDTKARSIGSYTINHLGGYTKTETELDFAGMIKKTKVYHKRLDTDTEKVISQNFEYDNQNRMMKHRHQVGSGPVEVLTENTYNELSQLSNKKVGNNLQSIDYIYNIKGSVIKVNDPASLGTKLFGYELRYQDPSYPLLSTGKYNGNITEVTWKTAGDNVAKRYNYQYDALNRLTKGAYSQPYSSIPGNGWYNESIAYDINSNIVSLQRNTRRDAAAVMMDNLNYNYTGNILNSITDASGNYSGYPDTSGNSITYDDNGNMKDHADKGILDIKYNVLNLPDYVKFDQTYIPRFPSLPGVEGSFNVNTQYLYRADGTKLRKQYTYASGKSKLQTMLVTEYLDGFQYENEGSEINFTTLPLKFVPTGEGYYNFENNKYIYSYTDHLGNVRLSYVKSGTGTEIIEENSYYPFGLQHDSYNPGRNMAYNYQYNGKELQQETGWNDYGARMYMADIGRWGVIDALAEATRRFSPYNYALNNPVMFIDPDGRKVMPYRGPVSEYPSQPMGGMLGFLAGGGVPNRSGILKFLGYEDSMGAFFFEMERLARRDDTGGGGGSSSSNNGSKASSTENVDEKRVNINLEEIVVRGKKGDWHYNQLVLHKALLAALEKQLDKERNFAYSVIGGFASYIANSLDGFIGTTKEKFFSFSGGTNDPDPYTLDKLRPGDKIEANDMFEYILNGFNRSRTPKREDGLYQFAIDIQGIGNPFSREIDSIALIEQVIKSPFISPYDTIKMTIPANKYRDSVQFNEAVKKVNYSNDMKTYNRIHFLGRTNWK